MASANGVGTAVLEKLRSIPLFEAIEGNTRYMELLIAICRLRTFKKGDQIIREGDVGSQMYVLNRGEVLVRKRTRAGDTYTVVDLTAEQNVFFGELALIDDERRSATVVAKEECECIEITKENFLQLGNDYPEIGLPITRVLAKILASRLRKTTEDMMTIFDALVNELKG